MFFVLSPCFSRQITLKASSDTPNRFLLRKPEQAPAKWATNLVRVHTLPFTFLSIGKHECDSESGFCPDKCPYTNGSYPYWRIRNAADVPFLWVVSGIKFYDTAASTKALNAEPKRGYASSYFGPGESSGRHLRLRQTSLLYCV